MNMKYCYGSDITDNIAMCLNSLNCFVLKNKCCRSERLLFNQTNKYTEKQAA